MDILAKFCKYDTNEQGCQDGDDGGIYFPVLTLNRDQCDMFNAEITLN